MAGKTVVGTSALERAIRRMEGQIQALKNRMGGDGGSVFGGDYDPAGTAAAGDAAHLTDYDHEDIALNTAARHAAAHDHSGVYDPAGTGHAEATAHVATHAALVSGVHGEDGEAVASESTIRYPLLIPEAEVDTTTILTKTGTATGITNKTFDSPIADDLQLSGQAMMPESAAAAGKLNYATDAGREAVGGQALEVVVKSPGSATYHRMILDNRQDCVLLTEIISYAP